MSRYEPFVDKLAEATAKGVYRRLRSVDSPQGTRAIVAGVERLLFSSNDYLGLANHPAIREAAVAAIGRYGWGSGSSRLVSGTMTPHRRFEEEIASFLGHEAALLFANGYSANVGLMTALAGRGDTVFADRLAHASLIDGARFSGARLIRFAHNDADDLDRRLSEHDGRGKRFVVTEGVFSMDGDLPPLAAVAALAGRNGAPLIVDDAHGVGLFGREGRGVPDHFGILPDVHVITLGKAFGSAGGVVAGSRNLIDGLVNFARPFIYSTAPPPAQASAASAALGVIAGVEGAALREKLFRLVELFRIKMADTCYNTGPSQSQIVPVYPARSIDVMQVGACLFDEGIHAPVIRPPTVPPGTDRFRISLTAGHTFDDIERLVGGLIRLNER